LGPYPLENDNRPKRKNTHHNSVSFWANIRHLLTKTTPVQLIQRIFVKKKVAKSLGFEGK
jgi:hypothetical protein